MAAGDRAAKMADRIKEIIARRLEKGLRDPRLGFVTITDVRVTGDLQHASVFFTVYGSDEERADSWAALKSATGMLRSEVGKNITARLTPSLEFIQAAIAAPYTHVTAPLRRLVDRFSLLVCEALVRGERPPAWVLEALPELSGIMGRAASAAGGQPAPSAEGAVAYYNVDKKEVPEKNWPLVVDILQQRAHAPERRRTAVVVRVAKTRILKIRKQMRKNNSFFLSYPLRLAPGSLKRHEAKLQQNTVTARHDDGVLGRAHRH